MTDWEVLGRYIGEHGQKYGTVSWQMARDSLKALRYKHENEKICPVTTAQGESILEEKT